ncbi:MAG: TonB-dependent receptor [Bacteroidia bacterium]|nr:TonB-dependent receptor [Bacteroidia bacterium]
MFKHFFGLLCFFMLVMGASQAQQTHPRKALYIKDANDSHPIEGAAIVVLNAQKEVVFEDSTNHGGYVILSELMFNPKWYFNIQHPSYQTALISFGEIQKHNYEVFLPPNSYELDEVVFTADKFQKNIMEVAYSISVLKKPEIELSNPQTSADLLAHNGKVFVQKSQMGGGSPNLRGFEANKVLLVIDGVRMNNAIYRSGHLQNVLTIDPEIVERSEVLFGPGSVIYGSDALGGVMHFYTLNPRLSTSGKTQVRGTISSRYGSVNHEKRLHGRVEIQGNKLSSLTSLSLTDYDDLRIGSNRKSSWEGIGLRDSFVIRENGEDKIMANPDPDIQRFSGYSQMDFLQKFLFIPNEKVRHTLNFQFSNSTDIPRSDRLAQLREGRLRYADWNYGPQKRLQASYHFHHTAKTAFWDEFQGNFAYQNVGESRNSRLFQSDWLNHRREKLDIGSINLDFQKKLAEPTLLAYGLEGFVNKVNSSAESENIVDGEVQNLDTRYPDGGSLMKSFAGYITVNHKLNKKLSFKAGLRWTLVGLDSKLEDSSFYDFDFDEISQRNHAFSGSVEAVYRPRKRWEIGWTAGSGFRAPNLDDVAKIFDSQPGNVVFPNQNLKPEYTYNTDLSIRYFLDKKFSIEATGFATYYDQAIVLRDAGIDSIFYEGVLSNVQINVNAQKAFLAGGSLGVLLNLYPISLRSSVNYSYGEVIDHIESSPKDHIPPLFGKSQLKFENNKITLVAEAFYQAWKRLDRFSQRDFNNLEFATAEGWPAWVIFNLRSEIKFSKKIRLQLGVENLADLHYRSYSSRISAPGRNIYSSIRLNF